MKLGKFYELIVRYGMQADPRGRKINEYFKKVKADYKKLSPAEKKNYDNESFHNPFADTRILYGRPQREINKILVGIDIEVSELLLADRLRDREGLDLVMSHHPEGMGCAALHEVMNVHGFILTKLGLKKEAVDDFLKERMSEVSRKLSAANHNRAPDAARLLDMPFMSCHTPADNFVARYLTGIMNKARPNKVKDILNILYKIPEYQTAAKFKAGPKIILGKPENRAGRVFVDMTGGTEGPKELFGRLSEAGVGTIVCMHLSEEHFIKAKPEHINVVIAGHIASDNLGVNLILDKIESHQKLEIIGCSGFSRVRR